MKSHWSASYRSSTVDYREFYYEPLAKLPTEINLKLRESALMADFGGFCVRSVVSGKTACAAGVVSACARAGLAGCSRFDGGAVAADTLREVATSVADEFGSRMGFDQALMQALGQVALRKLGKGAGEGGYGRQLLPARETTDALKDSFQYPLEGYSDPLWAKAHAESYAPQGTLYRQTINQGNGGCQPQHGLGDKTIGQRASILRRATDPLPRRYEIFDTRPLRGVDQLRKLRRQSFDFQPKSRDEFFLYDRPPLQ